MLGLHNLLFIDSCIINDANNSLPTISVNSVYDIFVSYVFYILWLVPVLKNICQSSSSSGLQIVSSTSFLFSIIFNTFLFGSSPPFCFSLGRTIFAVGIVVALPVPTESQSEGLGRLPTESLINQKV